MATCIAFLKSFLSRQQACEASNCSRDISYNSSLPDGMNLHGLVIRSGFQPSSKLQRVCWVFHPGLPPPGLFPVSSLWQPFAPPPDRACCHNCCLPGPASLEVWQLQPKQQQARKIGQKELVAFLALRMVCLGMLPLAGALGSRLLLQEKGEVTEGSP